MDHPDFTEPLGHRAIVLGASMAGLLAARVLAERFREVWLLERDVLPAGAVPRKGTPQAQHAHGLLARGCQILETLFPGYLAALVAQGALAGDLLANAPFVASGHRFAEGHGGARGIACSRLAIEAEVRRRVLALPPVQLLQDVDVLHPVLDTQRSTVTGVRLRHRATGAEETLDGELVVDCTGRGSRTPDWLRNNGYDEPLEERVAVAIGYATAYLRRDPQPGRDIAALIFAATPDLPLPGVLLAQEPGADGVPRWVVTLGGYAGDHPVPAIDAMRERARRMGDPLLVSVLNESELLAPVSRYAFPFSQRRRYELVKRFPQRLLVLGDAMASFNPVYGQGMTVAACQAMALRAGLGASLGGIHARFFKEAARAIDTAWQLAVGADLAIPAVAGPRPPQVRVVNGYMKHLMQVAAHDPKVALAFVRVAHLLSPPATLFAPPVAARVLWGSRPRGHHVQAAPAA